MRTNWVAIGALWGAVGVGMGAFGAHGLEERATPKQVEWWLTAAQYHLFHALAIVACGVVIHLHGGQSRAGRAAAWALFAGSLVFSGTLYAMTLGAPTRLGMITPLGGVAMIVGWAMLARAGVTLGSARSSAKP